MPSQINCVPARLVLALTLSFTTHLAQAAVTIDTFTFWDGVNAFGPVGEPNSATIGQTFTVPADDSLLTSFAFAVDDFGDADRMDFDAFVMRWDGAKATGPILFTSGPFITGNLPTYETFTIDTGQLALTPGQQYVAFFSASNRFDGIQGRARVGIPGSNNQAADVYAGGNLVFQNNGANFSLLTSTAWLSRNGDMAFRMTFVVPEPTAIGSLIVAWAFLARIRWRCAFVKRSSKSRNE